MDVGGKRQGLSSLCAHLFSDTLQVFAFAAGQDDRRTVSGEDKGRGAANTGAAAGDDGDASAQIKGRVCDGAPPVGFRWVCRRLIYLAGLPMRGFPPMCS